MGPWCGALRDCGLDSAEVSKPTVPTSGIHKEYGWLGFDTARLGCHVGIQSIRKPGIYTRKQMDVWATLRLDGLKSQKQKHIKLYASIGSTIVTVFPRYILSNSKCILFMKHIFIFVIIFIITLHS